MKYDLIQTDSNEAVITRNQVDVTNWRTIRDSIHYYDVAEPNNQRELKEWVESGAYEREVLYISGDWDDEEAEEDGFFVEAMYLEIVKVDD